MTEENVHCVFVLKCPLCGDTERSFVFRGHEHEYDNTTSQEFSFYRCTHCSLVYMDPRPSEFELGRIYPINYYSRASVNSASDDLKLNSFTGRWLHKRLLDRVGGNILPHLKLNSMHSFLDVGCGGGRALRSIHAEYGCRCIGIDTEIPAAALVRYASPPIRLYRGDFLSHDFGDEVFDVVYASHLIEHLPDPNAFMRKASSILRPGGLCVIETPNEDCSVARLFGSNWGGNHIPRHWFLLNPKTAKMLEDSDRSTGFKLISCRFTPNAAFLIWSLHSTLSRTLGRCIADMLFPSDHRIVSTGAVNVMRHGIFTLVDMIALVLTSRTGNMSVVYRKCEET